MVCTIHLVRDWLSGVTYALPDCVFFPYDKYRQYYPSSKTTCTCSDDYGTQCVATCASHITNYEIIPVTGAGVVHAVGSPANFVFGCGVQPNSDNQWDQFRTAFVVNTTACQCSDVYTVQRAMPYAANCNNANYVVALER